MSTASLCLNTAQSSSSLSSPIQKKNPMRTCVIHRDRNVCRVLSINSTKCVRLYDVMDRGRWGVVCVGCCGILYIETVNTSAREKGRKSIWPVVVSRARKRASVCLFTAANTSKRPSSSSSSSMRQCQPHTFANLVCGVGVEYGRPDCDARWVCLCQVLRTN